MDTLKLIALIHKSDTCCASCLNFECEERTQIMHFEMNSHKKIRILMAECEAYEDRRKVDRI